MGTHPAIGVPPFIKDPPKKTVATRFFGWTPDFVSNIH